MVEVLFMVMKQIKVSEEVKTMLDNLKLNQEPYNVTIQRIILENESLRADKEKLMQIALKKD